ncbi:unnamed protein product [Orchesella dallaii]|uniref:Uncharacterized protein n=1 Tax=Orchesella dallaii TaxID=48710 RepID=A0ABP1QMS6_9HEXA
MRTGRSTWRRKYIKAKQAELAKLRETTVALELILRMLATSCFLSETEEYCTRLEIQITKELATHYRMRAEYSQLLVDLYSHQVLRSDSDVSSELPVENEYNALETRSDTICNKIQKEMALNKAELKKIKRITKLRHSDVRKRAKQDPGGLETKMDQAIEKANEIKSNMDSLKAEWNGVKDELNSAAEGCIQQLNVLLQDIIAQEVGPSEE